MMRWFGEPWPRDDWRAPVCENDALRVPTPVGEKCILCEEVIQQDDKGEQYSNGPYVHAECALRSIIGGPMHISGECEYIGHCNHDGLTYRQQALQVWRMTM